MAEKNDYKAVISRARKRRNRGKYEKYFMAAGAAVIILLIVIAVRLSNRPDAEHTEASPGASDGQPSQTETMEESSTLSEEELEAQRREEEINQIVNSYSNLGISQASGYLNIRETAEANGKIIGKLINGSACEITETLDGWYKISSGGIEGYVSSLYLMTGEEAKALARDQIRERAVVTTNKLNIRQEPVIDPANVLGQALQNERYEVLEQTDGWIQIAEGWISADYVEVRMCLNEARKLDLRAMVLNQYDNIIISKVDRYLNIRSSPEEKGNENIIGKFPSRAAGEILETLDGWYKIKSGSITGYVKSEFTAVGQEARDLALEEASLMAIVRTDKLNVRAEPTVESNKWTQISKEERYPVLEQLDGWVQIELDTEDSDKAFIATRDNNVEVRYALNEAIKFSPLEEKANREASRRAQIVNYALQFVGNPYVWGGTSLTKGVDCSGFTMQVLGHFGISLPHYSGSQAKMGKAVSSSEMRPGDLIFYTNSRGVVNHVAMYIGNGQIVHAASRRSGIKISTWNYRRPKTIRNLID
ncbi:SH3 domain-containing protein [Lachnospiraceae bacterium 62-35]